MNLGSEKSPKEVSVDADLELEELIQREALQEFAESFQQLFRVPLRIFSESGLLIADAAEPPEIYQYLGKLKAGRRAVDDVVAAVKKADPGLGETSYLCFTGAEYHIVALLYDERRVGRLVLGPFLPPTLKEIPPSLMSVDPDVHAATVKELLLKVPRVRPETIAQISRHFRKTLDLILFTSHKAVLTSSMHLASIRQGFSDLERKNRELQQAYDKLKELDRLKSNFLATVSHELRTPLTSIIGYSEMLLEGIVGQVPEEQREFVSTIHDKGEQLLDMISGLLDLSKLESGTLSMKRAEVDLQLLVTDVIQTLTPNARRRGILLAFNNAPSGMKKLVGDETRLRQVLLNLGENALKFTPQGGEVRLHLELAQMTPSRDDDEDDAAIIMQAQVPAVRITVSDTGIGIPEEEKPKVFQAFYQVDSSSTRAAGGTGLGLSIVKRLVDGHEGRIDIADNQPRGAKFIVTLPYRELPL